MGYDKKQIIVIDGWDRTEINANLKYCTYYKRELLDDAPEEVLPINFAFPEDKIIKEDKRVKTKVCGTIVPVNCSIDESYKKTYVFDSEKEYYEDYRTSLFGLTSKKGGWDTLRHYEIIANGCIPLFRGIEECPQRTLHNFPKELCVRANNLPVTLNWKEGCDIPTNNWAGIDMDNPISLKDNFDNNEYTALNLRFLEYMKEHLTTKKLAEYILGNI